MKKENKLIPMNLQLFASEITMDAMDTNNGKMARCYITVDGRRHLVMELKKLDVDTKKNKTTIPILGRTMDGNVARGEAGTFTAVLYYVSDFLREHYYEYSKTGKDFYFDMQATNEDPKSKTGRHTVIFEGCNLNGMKLSVIDVESEALEETIEGTFENYRLVEKFNELEGAF